MLPINEYKNQIVSAVSEHKYTIITAPTGTGKTTQVPQFLAEVFDQVITTQPRILAAITSARRVAEERGVEVGTTVGYRTGFDSCYSTETKILFSTDGLQVVCELFNDTKYQNRVLIVDELHEWNIHMEALLAWCKKNENKWNTKVVFMSATLDAHELRNFLGNDTCIIDVPQPSFEVEEEFEYCGYSRFSQQTLIENNIAEEVSRGNNILVFLPGKREIQEAIKELEGSINAVLLPLHGELDWENQQECFKTYDRPKVIFATNVAQTSVTIPDIDVVIDSGLAKISRAENNIQGLFLEDISQADIIQRKGRVGRTKKGKYILVSRKPIEKRHKETSPEIMRSLLDRVVLQLASVGIDAEDVNFYHQPSIEAIRFAKKELKQLEALDEDGQVTKMGKKIVALPMAPKYARMIIEAEKYGVVDDVVTIAAILENGTLLAKGTDYYVFTSEQKSDLLAELDVWKKITSMGYISDFSAIGVSKKTFFRIKEYIQKVKNYLNGRVDFFNHSGQDDKDRTRRANILKSCLVGLRSNIYVDYGIDRRYIRPESESVRLSYGSCIGNQPKIIVGIPFTIQTRDGIPLTLINFATALTEGELEELAPNLISEIREVKYDQRLNIFIISITRTFLGIPYSGSLEYVREGQERFVELQEEVLNITRECITIGKHDFWVNYRGYTPTIEIDLETLFTTNEDAFYTKNGQPVIISCYIFRFKKSSFKVSSLRDECEDEYTKMLFESITQPTRIVVPNLEQLQNKISQAQPIVMGKDKCGFGEQSIIATPNLICIKNKVYIQYSVDGVDEQTDKGEREALDCLFKKYLQEKYPDKRFSKAKNLPRRGPRSFASVGLSPSEKKIREEFFAFAEEIEEDLTTENVSETIEIIESWFMDLMK